jgi:hypothetical protein
LFRLIFFTCNKVILTNKMGIVERDNVSTGHRYNTRNNPEELVNFGQNDVLGSSNQNIAAPSTMINPSGSVLRESGPSENNNNVGRTERIVYVKDNRPRTINTFGGRPEECPDNFVVDCEEYFDENSVREQDKVKHATRFLRGAARDWWTTKGSGLFSWSVFKTQLIKRYGVNNENRGILHANLFLDPQRSDETGSAFIARKSKVYERLFDKITDRTPILAASMLVLMTAKYKDSFREVFSGDVPFDEFERKVSAMDFPTDIVYPIYYASPYMGNSQGYNDYGTPKKCFICSGNHLKRFCPRREQNNYYEQRSPNYYAQRPFNNNSRFTGCFVCGGNHLKKFCRQRQNNFERNFSSNDRAMRNNTRNTVRPRFDNRNNTHNTVRPRFDNGNNTRTAPQYNKFTPRYNRSKQPQNGGRYERDNNGGFSRNNHYNGFNRGNNHLDDHLNDEHLNYQRPAYGNWKR